MKALLRRFVVLAMPLLWAAGCSEMDGPLRVEPAPGEALFSAGQGSPNLSELAKFRTRPAITVAWAKKWIGPEGGRLDFHGFAVEVPRGAVSKVTQFSIRLPVDPGGSERVVAEFGPHGATFPVKVAIEVPYAGTTMQASGAGVVVWWDPWQGAWVPMPGTSFTTDGLRLRTLTDHFSTYGAMEAWSGGVIASGG